MKKSVRCATTTQPSACFVPIQSFDLAAQDPLLDLFAGASIDAIKHEVHSIELHTPTHNNHTHTYQTHRRSVSDSDAIHPDVVASNPLVFLTAALPVPPQLDPPAKRRKRRAPSVPKHVQDLAKLQELSSSETSDSERGGSVKLQLRKLKNRASAAKSRLKAQARQEQLEKDVVELHRQNAYLRELVVAMAKATGQPLPVLPQLADGVSFDVAL